jgi:N-acetyl sugar amidotransferase
MTEKKIQIDSTVRSIDSLTSNPNAYFGLPVSVKYCSLCSYSNQKPNSAREFSHSPDSKKETVDFDDSNVCAACRYAEKKKKVNWAERENELRALCDKYRKTNGEYDCIVPGSGGKDSFYTSYVLKYKYGMNPLTVTWAPHIYTSWGWDNFQSWIHSGFDNQLHTPNGRVHRVLTRLALEKLFHPFQPFIMGQMQLPPKIAFDLNIPLVFYGENPVEYGNKVTGDDSPKKTSEAFTSEFEEDMYIAGTSYAELVSEFGMSKLDLAPYLPLSREKFESSNINVQYLGYYLPWHPQELFYFAVENGGFKPAPERTAGTYSKYSSIDDKIDDFHYYCTFIKFGIGRATYDSSQEIRNGEISRSEAISLIEKYDGEYPTRFEKECFDYFSLDSKEFSSVPKHYTESRFDREAFQSLADSFRSPHIWCKCKGSWHLRKPIYQILDSVCENTVS